MVSSSTPTQAALLNKVPVVTLIFWVIKILSTTAGETGADFLIFKLRFGLPLTSAIMAVALLVVLALQLRSDRYVPWIYWLTVVLVSIFGTLLTDSLVDTYGVALTTTTAVFSVLLGLTFILWYARERSLSIQTIYRGQREYFYWTAILMTFALGTAAGDLVAEQMHLGYAISAMIFALCISLVAVAHYALRLNAVATFWVAYVLTRPFGASVGDWLSHSVHKGGLGFGTVTTSEVFTVIILVLVGYLTLKERHLATTPTAG
ncbi:MAG: hypothetical protein RSE94_14745 [Pseudomonas sp.]